MELSIVIPNYNYGHFIKQTILSCVSKTWEKDLEIIVVDDGSTDESEKVIRDLMKSLSLIRFLKHPQNMGIEEAVSTGLSHARGKYVHFCASDDLFLPGALEIVFEQFKKHPTVALFCSNNAFFTSSTTDNEDFSSSLKSNKLLPLSHFKYFAPSAVHTLFSHTDFWIPGHTMFAKKENISKYFPYDKKLRFVCDWWINHQMALEEGIGYLPQNIKTQRMHPSSYSASPSLERRREVWLYLLHLLEKEPAKHKSFRRTGICRMLGIKAIYKDLLKTPRYWKYLLPICRKILEKRAAHLFHRNRERYWLKRI